ncbi:MAG TPA: ribosomal L7Ae/L30e/S12e/Gadd45 family protein [Bacilli bacterium]
MSYDRITQAGKLCIGAKQTAKLIELGMANEVFIAKDADPRVTLKITNLCKKTGMNVTYVDSMKQLGKACRIAVGAAVAAIVNE